MSVSQSLTRELTLDSLHRENSDFSKLEEVKSAAALKSTAGALFLCSQVDVAN